MSKYRDSKMHKSIMAEKDKQDADTKAKAKAKAKKSKVKDSSFVEKSLSLSGKYASEDAKRKKILSNPIGAAAAWLKG